MLLNEISNFDKIAVEFVSGATPTAHLFDADGNDLDSFVLGDIDLDGLLKLFEQHGFPLMLKGQMHKSANPSSVTEIGNVYYELYPTAVAHKTAKEFAELRMRGEEKGRILTYNCSFQEAHIRKWLSTFRNVNSIWLGGERVDNTFKWVDGPLSGISFLNNASQYSNWVAGEPNNAGGHESCAVQNLKELSGWNDVHCLSHQAHLVVEYGKTVVPCPIIADHEKTQQKYDPNHEHIPQEEVDL